MANQNNQTPYLVYQFEDKEGPDQRKMSKISYWYLTFVERKYASQYFCIHFCHVLLSENTMTELHVEELNNKQRLNKLTIYNAKVIK